MPLHVHTLTVGPLQSNCHVVADAQTGQAIIFDPGDEAPSILAFLAERKLNPAAIWLTHAHIDHIGALAAVYRATEAPISIHPAEKDWLSNPDLNLATWIGIPFEIQPAHEFWNDGDEREALGHRWRVMHVPGHSPGQCAIICESENIAISGDLIFEGSMGRIDLPGGDAVAMASSLVRFLELPGATRLYVGHGGDTTIAHEKAENWVVRDFLERA